MMEARYVEWIDSVGGSGWEELGTAKEVRPLTIFTLGFVLDEGEDYVTILQSYDERKSGKPHGDHYICIPKFAITSSRTIKKAD